MGQSLKIVDFRKVYLEILVHENKRPFQIVAFENRTYNLENCFFYWFTIVNKVRQ